MFSAYIKNMNNQNKLNLTLLGKIVMENISLSVKTKMRSHIIPTLKTASGDSIIYDDEICSAKITAKTEQNAITVFLECYLKESSACMPDSFCDKNSVTVEFSAPQVSVSLSKKLDNDRFTPTFSSFNTVTKKTDTVIAKCDKGYIKYVGFTGDNYKSFLNGFGTHSSVDIEIGNGGYNKICGQILHIEYSADVYSLLNTKSADKNIFSVEDRVIYYAGFKSENEIFADLKKFKQNGIAAKIVIFELYKDKFLIDDIYADQKRFCDGLSAFIKTLKKEYNIEHVGARYPLGLAHRGIEKDSKADRELKPFTFTASGGYIVPICDLQSAYSFYDKINKYLLSQGVSFVTASKIYSLYGCVNNNVSTGQAQKVYLPSFIKSAVDTFSCYMPGAQLPPESASIRPRIINDTYLHTLSDKKPNNTFTLFKFTSKQAAAFFTVSGEELVLGEVPDESLKSLLTDTSRALKCDDKMRVCRRNLFSDPAYDSKALRVFNFANASAVVSAFNVSEKGETVKSDICADDIDFLEGNKFVCRIVNENKFMIVGRDTRIPLSLAKHNAQILIFTPIKDGVAILGNIDKLNSPKSFTYSNSVCRLCDTGRVALYSDVPFNSDIEFVKSGNIYIADAKTKQFKLDFLPL